MDDVSLDRIIDCIAFVNYILNIINSYKIEHEFCERIFKVSPISIFSWRCSKMMYFNGLLKYRYLDKIPKKIYKKVAKKLSKIIDESRKKQCEFCKFPYILNKICSKCCKIYYCSIECQKQDWIEHKKICGIEK